MSGEVADDAIRTEPNLWQLCWQSALQEHIPALATKQPNRQSFQPDDEHRRIAVPAVPHDFKCNKRPCSVLSHETKSVRAAPEKRPSDSQLSWICWLLIAHDDEEVVHVASLDRYSASWEPKNEINQNLSWRQGRVITKVLSARRRQTQTKDDQRRSPIFWKQSIWTACEHYLVQFVWPC